MALGFQMLLMMVCFLAMSSLRGCSGATATGAIHRAGVVYHVGDSIGWSILADYHNWTSTRKFHVGDTLIFTYDKVFLDLMQVSLQDYQSCNTKAKSPIAVYATGSDLINLKKPGDYYFIGGRNFEPEWYALSLKNPTYCNAGQKLHVKVLPLPIPTHQLIASPTPAPTPKSLYHAQSQPHHPVAATSPSSAPSSKSLHHHGQPTSSMSNAAAPSLPVVPFLITLITLVSFVIQFV